MEQNEHGTGDARVFAPELGRYIQATRLAAKLSQADLAHRSGVTYSYITKLEQGDKTAPTKSILAAVARTLRLDDAGRWHMYHLAGLDPEIESFVAVEDGPIELTRFQRGMLTKLEPDLVAIFDMRWTILACNDSYRRAFPGMMEAGNIMRWYFGAPTAREVLVEWEREAALNVAWFRGLMGQHYPAPWSVRLLRELAQYPDFRRLWSREDHVVFGRAEEDSVMRLRDLATGGTYGIRLDRMQFERERHPVRCFVGVREDSETSIELS